MGKKRKEECKKTHEHDKKNKEINWLSGHRSIYRKLLEPLRVTHIILNYMLCVCASEHKSSK